MARAYAASGPSESGTADKTAVTIIAATTVRPAIFDAILGSVTAPADVAILAFLARFTAAGTAASNPVPEPLDAAEAAALATAGITHSAEPTYTANKMLVRFAFNQRNTVRWVAAPGCELRAPATAANGIGAKISTAGSAVILQASLMFAE